jgi:SAM-dependent methyltransferase
MIDVRDHISQINTLARQFMNSQVLFAANEADVFSHLEKPATAAEVASKVDWDSRATRMLLDGLVALGLVTKSGERYQNTAAASACLVPGRPAYQGNIVRHIRYTASGWYRLEESLRSGKAADSERRERPAEELRAFILGMNDIARTSAKEILNILDLSPYRHLLDLGGGPAAYAITFLEAHPRMKAAVFDLPAVIPIAREQVHEAKMEGRISFIAGDMLTNSYGSGYDLILLSNIIHSFGPKKNQTIVQKCSEALQPGGLFIIKDFLADNDRSGPAYSLMFALHMLVGTGEGDTYTFSQVQEWTREAGLEDFRGIDLTPQTRMWLTRKPFPAARSSLIGFLDKTPPSKLRHGDFTPDE